MSEGPAVGTDLEDELLDAPGTLPAEASEASEASERELDWWHRDHPTFTALSGFFSGLVLVTLVPGLFFAALSGLFSERTAEEAFPFVLLFLAVPTGLLVFPRTRRFGKYLLLGMTVTLLVVFGVGTLVFWLMLANA